MLQTEHFNRCIQTLDASFALLKRAKPGSVEYEVYRNATIKGFELVLETGGKLIGKYLRQFFASPGEVDRLYFKDVLRHAAKHGLLPPDEVRRWFSDRDNRNLTAHDYGEALAEEALKQVEGFIADARALAGRLAERQGGQRGETDGTE